jgi:hypothetical protein
LTDFIKAVAGPVVAWLVAARHEPLTLPTAEPFPLSVSANGRYVVKTPFLLGTIESVADLLLPTARPRFNCIQLDLICTGYVGDPDGTSYTTREGIAPFTGAKVTTPNPVYFARMVQFVRIMRQNGLAAYPRFRLPSTNDACVQALINGVQSVAPNQLRGSELCFAKGAKGVSMFDAAVRALSFLFGQRSLSFARDYDHGSDGRSGAPQHS